MACDLAEAIGDASPLVDVASWIENSLAAPIHHPFCDRGWGVASVGFSVVGLAGVWPVWVKVRVGV